LEGYQWRAPGFSHGSSARRRQGADTASGATVDLYTNISISHRIGILGAGNARGNCGMECRPQVFLPGSRRPYRSNIGEIVA